MFNLQRPIGRTGNILFQNIGLSIVSKHLNLKPQGYINLDYFRKEIGLKVNLDGRIFENLENYNDLNISELFDRNFINSGVNYDGGFQDKKFVLDFRKDIVDSFELEYSQEHEEDLFIHVRLGDTEHTNPGIEYYEKSINKVNFNKGYISSDSPNHPMIKNLIEKYNLEIFDSTPLDTIKFGKNFGNIIISKGTFSWWIATLSRAKKVFVPVGDPSWYGDIFVFDDWNYIPVERDYPWYKK